MKPPLALVALALLLLTVASPGIEAIAGCLVLCPDELPGQDACASDVCCSCCIHSGPLFSSLPVFQPGLLPAGVPSTPSGVSVPPAHSSDILHVPKRLTA